MKEDFVTFKQAQILKKLGFDWDCDFIYYLPYHNHNKSIFSQYETVRDYEMEKYWYAPTIDKVQKWMREEMGIDIVISPKFNSKTGDRVGYFWRWSQRSDVNMNPKTFKTYEKALLDAIDTIISPFEDYKKTNNGG